MEYLEYLKMVFRARREFLHEKFGIPLADLTGALLWDAAPSSIGKNYESLRRAWEDELQVQGTLLQTPPPPPAPPPPPPSGASAGAEGMAHAACHPRGKNLGGGISVR